MSLFCITNTWTSFILPLHGKHFFKDPRKFISTSSYGNRLEYIQIILGAVSIYSLTILWMTDLGMHQHAFLYHFPISRTAEHQTNHLKAEWDPKASSVSTRLSEFATESNRLRNKHAHRKYSNSFLGVKQTTHSRESYVSTCNEVCPRKILPPHFFTAHFTKAPPPTKKTRMPALLFSSPLQAVWV